MKIPMAMREVSAPPMRVAADFGAGIASHAIKLARLYLERAQMHSQALDSPNAAADRGRAQAAWEWGVEAASTANTASREMLDPFLADIREELDLLSARQRVAFR